MRPLQDKKDLKTWFILERPALLDALTKQVQDRRFILVDAPRGGGKTVCLRHFYRHYFSSRHAFLHTAAIRYDFSTIQTGSPALPGALHRRLKHEVGRRGFDWGEVPWVPAPTLSSNQGTSALADLCAALIDEGLSLGFIFDHVDFSSPAFPQFINLVISLPNTWILLAVDEAAAIPAPLSSSHASFLIPRLTSAEALAILERTCVSHGLNPSREELHRMVMDAHGHPLTLYEIFFKRLSQLHSV